MIESNSKLVSISGISEDFPKITGEFKEFKSYEILYIDDDKPTITDLIHVSVKVDNIQTEIFDTITSVSCEGKIFTGKSMFLSGSVTTNFKYTTNNYVKTIHNVKFETPFSTYVTLGKNFREENNFLPCVYVEDIKVRVVNRSSLYQAVLMLANVEGVY